MPQADGIDTVQWEYAHVTTPSVSIKDLVRRLNDLGAEGWQLVTMDDVDKTIGFNSLTAILRREIVPLPPPDALADGWHSDPSGRYDLRHWTGQAWTFHVARAADKSTHRDPPTARKPTADLVQ